MNVHIALFQILSKVVARPKEPSIMSSIKPKIKNALNSKTPRKPESKHLQKATSIALPRVAKVTEWIKTCHPGEPAKKANPVKILMAARWATCV
jgi:hypothetical protein